MAFQPRPVRGMSLGQLLAAMAIAATVVSAALPSFSHTSLRARGAASVNLLLGSLHYARSTAILRVAPTAVCLTADSLRCIEHTALEARGWLVFHDTVRRVPVQLDPEDTLLRTVELPARVSVQGSRTAVTYWPVARAGTTATFLLCHQGRPQHGRAVIVSQSGRARTAADGEWTDRLRCP